MNKSISISLGGLSFYIEEDAFMKLQKYLDDVKSSLETGEDDTDEILKDVEVRIAELFKEWLGNFRQVVDSKDVNKVISIMGTPEQYQSEIEEGNSEVKKEIDAETTHRGNKFYQRQLFRDMDDKIIAGVCSGLAHFFGMEPIWFRLGLVLLLVVTTWLFNGVAPILFLIYIILWIVTPKASTTSEKLKMKGKPINFDSIKEYINKEEISEQAGKIKNNISKTSNGIRDFLESFFKILGKIIAIFTGFIFIIISISFIISYFVCSFSLSFPLINSYEYINLFFDSSWHLYTMVVLLGIVILVPSFTLLFLGLKLVTGREIIKISTTALITLFVIWLITSIIVTGMSITLVASQFGETVEKDNKCILRNVTSDTLCINMKEYQGKTIKTYQRIGRGTFGINTNEIRFTKDSVIKSVNRNLKIKQSTDSDFYLEIKTSATGDSELNALNNLTSVNYKYQVKNSKELLLNSYLSFPKNNKYRNQNVEFTIYVPKDKFVQITNGIMLSNTEGSIDIYYNKGKNTNKLFKFVGGALRCLNCDKIDNLNIKIDSLQKKDKKRISIKSIKAM